MPLDTAEKLAFGLLLGISLLQRNSRALTEGNPRRTCVHGAKE